MKYRVTEDLRKQEAPNSSTAAQHEIITAAYPVLSPPRLLFILPIPYIIFNSGTVPKMTHTDDIQQ